MCPTNLFEVGPLVLGHHKGVSKLIAETLDTCLLRRRPVIRIITINNQAKDMNMSNMSREAEAWVDPASDGSNLCPLCCETDLSSSSLCAISLSCNHTTCAPCMVTWIEKQECNGGPPASLPGCPFCRAEMSQGDVRCILGRPYQPKQPTITDTLINEAEIDDLTLDWLNEHTMLCQGCGSRIEKESGEFSSRLGTSRCRLPRTLTSLVIQTSFVIQSIL